MATGRLHFHPDLDLVESRKNTLVLKHKKGIKLRLKIHKCEEPRLDWFEYSKGFNHTVKAIRVVYTFSEKEKIELKVI